MNKSNIASKAGCLPINLGYREWVRDGEHRIVVLPALCKDSVDGLKQPGNLSLRFLSRGEEQTLITYITIEATALIHFASCSQSCMYI